MSQAVTHAGTIYLSGQVADDTSAALAGQVRQVLAKIESLLTRAGSSKSKILSTSIWLASMSDFEEMSKAWQEWVPTGCAPARATVEARLVTPGHRVEIAVIAAI